MSFDARGFMRAEFEARTETVFVPALEWWFAEADPVFLVRGLTAAELARINEAADKQPAVESVIEALADDKAQSDAVREALGRGKAVPSDTAKRIEQMIIACVEPKMDRQLAVKLSETYPIEFFRITNKIVELTGRGMDLKKSLASGAEATSAA